MELAKGIPTGSPILDASAVWTPPAVGAPDAAHVFLAHTRRGLSNPVKELVDMVGGGSIKTNGAGNSFTDSETSPLVTINQGSDALTGAGSPAPEQTVLFVAQIVANKSAQVTVPGWVIGGGGNGRITVSGSSFASFTQSPPTGLAVYVLTLKAGEVRAWVNGASVGTLTLQPGTASTIRLGTNVYTSTVTEQYGLLKIWRRILSPSEIADAVADAKKLFTIN